MVLRSGLSNWENKIALEMGKTKTKVQERGNAELLRNCSLEMPMGYPNGDTSLDLKKSLMLEI